MLHFWLSVHHCPHSLQIHVGSKGSDNRSLQIILCSILTSDASCRLIQHEYRVMFLMWACEVIMVCGKRWVVDCVTRDHFWHSYVLHYTDG